MQSQFSFDVSPCLRKATEAFKTPPSGGEPNKSAGVINVSSLLKAIDDLSQYPDLTISWQQEHGEQYLAEWESTIRQKEKDAFSIPNLGTLPVSRRCNLGKSASRPKNFFRRLRVKRAAISAVDPGTASSQGTVRAVMVGKVGSRPGSTYILLTEKMFPSPNRSKIAPVCVCPGHTDLVRFLRATYGI